MRHHRPRRAGHGPAEQGLLARPCGGNIANVEAISDDPVDQLGAARCGSVTDG